jgi:hypothetical protein
MDGPFYPKEVYEAWASGRRQGMQEALNICERGDVVFANSAAAHIKVRISKLKETP